MIKKNVHEKSTHEESEFTWTIHERMYVVLHAYHRQTEEHSQITCIQWHIIHVLFNSFIKVLPYPSAHTAHIFIHINTSEQTSFTSLSSFFFLHERRSWAIEIDYATFRGGEKQQIFFIWYYQMLEIELWLMEWASLHLHIILLNRLSIPLNSQLQIHYKELKSSELAEKIKFNIHLVKIHSKENHLLTFFSRPKWK